MTPSSQPCEGILAAATSHMQRMSLSTSPNQNQNEQESSSSPTLTPAAAESISACITSTTSSSSGATSSTYQNTTASGRPVVPRRIDKPIAVAPMVDVTTPHFLHLCRIISPKYTLYTEMIHCNALVYHPDDLYNFFGEPWEGKVVQLGGSDPVAMAKAALLVQDNGYTEVNVNVGCPSPKVQKGAFGAVLMKTPSSVVDIIQEMVKVGVTIPITVKCRIGVDNLDSYEYLHDFLAQDFPHLTITINGGFHTTEQIKEQLNLVDGIMIGREVMDNPMFLAKVDAGYYNVPPENIKSTEEVIEEFLEYVLTEHERGTPNSKGIVMAPLKMLYNGHRGREYRRRLAAALSPRTKSLPDAVRDVRLMMQEMDYGGVTTTSEAEDGSDGDSDSDSDFGSEAAASCAS
ncbi:hypothetical protein BG004_003663 [Podila humilis]|nr:hypothetical protein BG004_003663 [Podila humilis]